MNLWKQGRVLMTSTTKSWSKSQLDAANAFEKKHVFENFDEKDQGCSRLVVASCEKEEDAELITEAVNACKQISPENPLAAAKEMFNVVDTLREVRDCLEYFGQINVNDPDFVILISDIKNALREVTGEAGKERHE